MNPQSSLLEYELRVPRDLGDRAEIARRQMLRAFDRENDVEFEAAARELLTIYPESSLAFHLRTDELPNNQVGSARLRQPMRLRSPCSAIARTVFSWSTTKSSTPPGQWRS